jgi:aminoglycoside phosphotransferase (APT) family kinase protein
MAVTTDDEIRQLLAAFMTEHLGSGAGVTIGAIARIGVGRSRENWLYEASWRGPTGPVSEELIVRRDPLGGLLETDRQVEFDVLAALEATAVPAPRPRWLDADGSRLGRPSLVMVREPGTCDYFVLNGDRPADGRRDLAARLCELLASVHAVDWQGAGLGRVLDDPGPEAATAELDVWEAVLRRDQLEPWPELELALHRLRRTAPTSPGTVLVHGDFKAGNVLLDEDRIVALLDWELVHLGDPHEDLGWVTQPLRTDEHLIPGRWEADDLLDHYQKVTGLAVDRDAVRWWNAFACLKTAIMQVSGLRSYVEGRHPEPYQPTAEVLRTLLELTEA